MRDPIHAQQSGVVWLVGLSGVGKSTIGRALAAATGRTFVDLDAAVEQRAGQTVTEIFRERGEAEFRAIEAMVARELADAGEPVVVAMGGGAPIADATRAAMQQTGLSIWLRDHVDAVMARMDRSKRPLLANEPDPRAKLVRLEEERAAAYGEADLVVAREGRDAVAVAESIARWLAACGAHSLSPPPATIVLHSRAPLAPVVVEQGADSDAAAQHFAQHLARRLPPGLAPIGLVTDENVGPLHAARYLAALQHRGYRVTLVTVPAGERCKRLGEVGRVAEALVAGGLDRGSTIVALGGGAVSDLAGFVAATLHRGVAFVPVPTTLLAQVDASVGGKTAVNLDAGKNLLGAFHQPRLVFLDPTTLATLSPRDRRAGLAEMVKHALLDPAGDGEHLTAIESQAEALARGELAPLVPLIERSVRFKAQVVAADVRETRSEGGRALLNLGHTVGHGARDDQSLAS